MLQAISSQVQQAEQRGLVTLAEVEASVDVDGILPQFIRDDKALKDSEAGMPEPHIWRKRAANGWLTFRLSSRWRRRTYSRPSNP